MSKATIYVSGIDIEKDVDTFATKHAEALASPTEALVAQVIRKGFRGVLAGVLEVHALDRARIAVLERHIEVLRAALKPFAEERFVYDDVRIAAALLAKGGR